MDPYQILGAPPDADLETLRTHYRRLVRVHHPDLASDETARVLATERMVVINDAWRQVNDPQRRALQDERTRWKQMDAARRKVQQQAVAHNAAQSEPVPAWVRERDLKELRARELFEQQQRVVRQRQVRAERQQAVRDLNQVLQHRLEEKVRGRRKVSPSARRLLREAVRLFQEEDRPGEAIALCQQVLRVDNRNIAARELLGDFYLQLGRADRALPLWEQALMLQPGNATIRRKLSALNPHDARSYKPQPRIPRSGSAYDIQHAAEIKAPARRSFWQRLRARFFGGF